MASASNFQTFRDPAFSLWQSAIHATLKNHPIHANSILARGAVGLAATADDPHMVASVQAIQELQKQGPAASGQLSPHAAGVVSTVLECAKLAAQLAWAEMFDRSKVPGLKSELAFSTCDPFWAECIVVYEEFIASQGVQPYSCYTNITDYVLTGCFPDTAKVAIIGDWGTGMDDALVLLKQIANNFQIDVLIHLGDIYYAGLPSEDSDHFVSLINQAWPSNPPLVFTLDGNHDRYAGSAGGYYTLISTLNKGANLPQPNSYFALRNNFWQFVAMDTGYHDTDPYTVISNVTYLEQSEVAWHLDKIQNNGVGVDAAVNPSGARGTILLSHHQLFSFSGVGDNANGQPLAINPNLASAFSSVFPQINYWFWGHEHDLCIFEPYSMGPGQPLPPGRCLGASAVPVFTPQATAPADLVLPSSESQAPKVIDGTALGNSDGVFNHAYAIMTLANEALTINYYQIASSAATPGTIPALAPLAYSDTTTAPAIKKAAAGSE